MSLTEDKQRVKAILKEWDIFSEILTTPIVFHPGGWDDTLPEWLRHRVIAERVLMACNSGWDKATDAEVTCYLYTASLAQPLGYDWTQITLYQAAKQMPQLYKVLPDAPKELNDYQKSELRDLKRKIRDSQIRRRKSKRKEKDMGKRKLVLEEHEASVLVGIIQDDCDPVTKTVAGTLEDAVAGVPDFLKEAQEKWAVQPKNPTYKPPATPKPAPAAAAATPAQPQKAEDLPLLSGTETPTPAEEQAPEPAVPEPTEPAAEEKEEEKVAEAKAEVTEPQAAPAEIEPEAEVPPAELSEEVKERLEVASDSELPQPPVASAAPAPSTPAKPGEWDYYLQDGRGPFESVQAAMDELGLDKASRPTHNRWDRLSTALKEKIQRRPKS